MYTGFSKDNGGIIGQVAKESASIDIGEASITVGAEESFQCITNDGNIVSMVASLCPLTGDILWNPEDIEGSVIHRTISMSQMPSMLRDVDRNLTYEKAIAKCISHFTKLENRKPKILDIGTGTGLLSMFAMRNGGEEVIGCEMFDSMATIAREIVSLNRFEEKISVVPLKSTELECPPFADIIISEILDSSLLGESCLSSHLDSISRLMNLSELDKCNTALLSKRIIPSSANIFATMVESNLVKDMRDINSIGMDSWIPFRNEFARECNGGWPLMPCHWRELESRGGKRLSQPQLLMKVDFNSMENINQGEISPSFFETEILVTDAGVIHGILLWWEVNLLCSEIDPLGECIYSTEPGIQNWQDHWVQIIYPLPTAIVCAVGDAIQVKCAHDNIKIWLDATKLDSPTSHLKLESASVHRPPLEKKFKSCISFDSDEWYPEGCSCGWHMLCGSERIQMLNDRTRRSSLFNASEELAHYLAEVFFPTVVSNSESGKLVPIILDVSDGSMISLTISQKLLSLGCQQLRVVSKETKEFSNLLHEQIANANRLENMIVWNGQDWSDILFELSNEDNEGEISVPDSDDNNCEDQNSTGNHIAIAALVSECYYYQLHALPTWQAISFLYQRSAVEDLLLPNAAIFPHRASIMAAPFELLDLHISHGLVGTVHGFDHSPLDARMDKWSENMFPYKLGSYRKKLLCKPICIAELNYQNIATNIDITRYEVKCKDTGICHCVAIWVDYELDIEGKYKIENFCDGDFPLYYTANLKFFPQPVPVDTSSTFVFESSFCVGDSDLNYYFDVI